MANNEKPEATSESFITESPLYTKVTIFNFAPPARISFNCAGKCRKETTWVKSYDEEPLDQSYYAMRSVGYKCGLCNESRLFVVYHGAQAKHHDNGWDYILTKVGQYPGLSVQIPKSLEQSLGESASDLYRKALICRNSGYGLGAATYFRRVVEDKTNELIEVAAELAESFGIAPEQVQQIRKAANSTVYTPFEDKLRIAGAVFPDSLKVNGVNPLGLLYDLVSKAIHGLSEEECIEVADETAEAFSFVFANLKANVAERRSFVEKVNKWTTSKSAKENAKEPT